MSVLIQGLKMPQGESCVTVRIWGDGRVIGVHNDSLVKHAIELPPHGRSIDADEFLKRAIGTKCFRGDYALMLEELVGESTTIIPREEGE